MLTLIMCFLLHFVRLTHILEEWGTNPFPYFDDFVIIFGKDKVIGMGAEIATDAIEKHNDEDEEFVDAIENYHDEP